MRFDFGKVERQVRRNPGLLDVIHPTRRNREILKERIRGKSFAEIGKAYNLSGERIRQIYFSALYMIRKNLIK
jgi:DNA-directed RNA polymerase sigma subunit (sigma70/sigma32)